MSCLPVFINVQETEEIIRDLRSYLREKGAPLSEEPVTEDAVAHLLELVNAAHVAFKSEDSVEDVETVLNSFVSLILLYPAPQAEELISRLCDKLTDHDAYSQAKLKCLNNLFHGLEGQDMQRFNVYTAMIRLAGRADLMHVMKPNLEQIKAWMARWDVSVVQYQALLRSLHEGLVTTTADLNIKAAAVMMELLGTYTEDTAAQARQDAHKCIVTNLADPHTYVLDHLLALKPVKFLEGEPIHDLLTIFISGRLQQYMQFYDVRTDFMQTLNLSHEACMSKMRVLTMMSIADTQNELTFDQLQREMQLGEEDIEPFIIDLVRTKYVVARLDHVAGKVHLTATTQRSFGKPQWLQLRERLISWQQNLGAVLGSLDSLIHHVQPPPQVAAKVDS